MGRARHCASTSERGAPWVTFGSTDRGWAGRCSCSQRWWRCRCSAIGRRRAILEVGNFKIAGFAAWLSWLIIHIYYLAGFKSRLFVVLQWAMSYFTYGRGARLIVGKEWRSYAEAARNRGGKSGE